jgi:DNA polymerase-4
MERVILHSDLNNFFASVESLSHPELIGKPVAVAGDVEARHGIILAKNEIAKSMGVRTGEPLWEARRKCRDIVFLPPHYELYEKYSRLARRIYLDYTDMVEPFGMDECWLDVTGSLALFGDGETIADLIRERIKRELGLTVSVGVSFNKVFAKLGSDMRKPDATTVISQEDFKKTVWELPASDLLFVGRKTYSKLTRLGMRTIGDVARMDPTVLKGLLGENGVTLHCYANGRDTSPVAVYGDVPPQKSIGNSTTAPRDLVREEDIDIVLYRLCENVSARMRSEGAVCCTVQLYVRYKDLASLERQLALDYPNRTALSLYESARCLMKKHGLLRAPIRSLGVRACQLIRDGDEQLSFMPEICRIQKAELVENTVDGLRERYGKGAIVRGIMLTDEKLAVGSVNSGSTFGHLSV